MNKKQEDRTIILDNGEITKVTFPVVVSASRSTDIHLQKFCSWIDQHRRAYYNKNICLLCCLYRRFPQP